MAEAVSLDMLGYPESGTPNIEQLPKVSSPDEAAKFNPGTAFLDPSGNRRVVPYRPKSLSEVDSLPEGAHFLDPSGNLREVPRYEGLDFTAQTLYDMAVNDKEREKALSRSYPGKVKRNERTGEFYVDDDGTLRRSKGFLSAPGATIAAEAAPVIGSIGGGIAGGVAGTFAGGPIGTLLGGAAGGEVGGATGQAFNDAIMGLAGVYDRSGSEEAINLAKSGFLGGLGAGIGGAGAGAAPAIKGTVEKALPKAAASFLGADKEGLETAIRLRGEGVLVPPSGWAKEAPHIHNIVEVFDPAFHTQRPLQQSATQHYEKEAGRILESKEIGGTRPASLSDPEVAVSTEKTGEALLGRSRQELAAADAKLRQVLEAKRTAVQAGAQSNTAYMEALRATERESRAAADKVIAEGFKAIDTDIDRAMKAVKADQNSGDLWQQVGDKLRKIKVGISQRAAVRYQQADELAGGHLPDIGNLTDVASNVLAQMPEGFEGKYPTIVKQIRDLAGVVDEKTGGWVKEPVQPSFGELHNLRTVLRNNINYFDLTPDFREGAVKLMERTVNEVLHDQEAVPELQAAAHMLDETDKWYGKVIKPLTDKNIQAVVSGLESGMPADPKLLYDTLVKEGRTELTNKVKKLVGPNLWAGIKASDIKEMLDQSKTLTPGVIDGRRFARQVLDRYRTGMLTAVHGEQAGRLLEQARNIEMLEGKLDIPTRPGDTILDVISRARAAADAVKAAAKQDPLALLNKEMKSVEREHAREAQRMAKLRQTDPLAFLYKPTTGATEAVDRILGSEDLILAAAAKFGDKSPEFNMLRQVWVQRILQGTLEPSQRLEKASEEVQRIMFPGVSLDAMRQLAKDMDFLMSSRGAHEGAGTARSMAAMSKVEHPLSQLPFQTGKLLNIATLGLGDPIARATLGGYYKMIRTIFNNPAFMRWVEKGLKGDDRAREMVREEIQRRMKIGGPVGAGVAQAGYQSQ